MRGRPASPRTASKWSAASLCSGGGWGRLERAVTADGPAPAGASLRLRVPSGGAGDPSFAETHQALAVGAKEARLTLPLGPNPRLWSLEDPHLYDALVLRRRVRERLKRE